MNPLRREKVGDVAMIMFLGIAEGGNQFLVEMVPGAKISYADAQHAVESACKSTEGRIVTQFLGGTKWIVQFPWARNLVITLLGREFSLQQIEEGVARATAQLLTQPGRQFSVPVC